MNSINLFMWPYQESFRSSIQYRARVTLSELGANVDAMALLVGIRSPESNNRNLICISPENGEWPLAIFDGVLETVESNVNNHELKNMHFGDAASMRDKPEWIRRGSVSRAFKTALESYDAANSVISFCSDARKIGDFHVVVVIQIPNSVFEQFKPLPPHPNPDSDRRYGYRSLIHATVYTVLDEAASSLETPEPGRFTSGMRSERETIQIAARSFLSTPGLSIGHTYIENDLFEFLNLVSSMLYEKTTGIGNLILVHPENQEVDFAIKFRTPVPFGDPRWARKILQMAITGVGVIADGKHIYGLGNLQNTFDAGSLQAFTVVFMDHYFWELRSGTNVLMRCHYGKPKLPQETFDRRIFFENYARLFPKTTNKESLHIWDLMQSQMILEHGSMIVVSEDAAEEALRLARQGTLIVPAFLSIELLKSLSSVDGSILVDPNGICYAFGVILDGDARDECLPSRGSRYNSAVRYIRSRLHRRFAIVASDDKTIEIVPKLMPLVSRNIIQENISRFEIANRDNYHAPRSWLNEHRFYMSAQDCERINTAIERLDALPYSENVIYIGTSRFSPHPDMEDGYLT